MRILRRTLPTVLAALATMVLGLTPARALDDGGGRSVFALGAGNRALALGGAFGAVADDASASLWNPAGLARLDRRQFQMTHTSLFGMGFSEQYMAAVYPHWRYGTFAVTVRLFGVDGIEHRDDRNVLLPDELQDKESEIGIAYGRAVGGGVFVGGVLKMQRQSLAGYSGGGTGLDLGVLLRPMALAGVVGQAADRWTVGVAVRNALEPTVRLDLDEVPDPRGLRLASAWRKQAGEDIDVLAAVDLDQTKGSDGRWHLGLEADYRRQFALRTGSLSGAWTAGFGVHWHDLALDYAYESNRLGDIQRLGLTFTTGPSTAVSRREARVAAEQARQRQLAEAFAEDNRRRTSALLSEATAALEREDYTKALERLGMLRILDPGRADVDSVEVAVLRGQARREESSGDLTVAILTLTRLLDIAPRDGSAAADLERLQGESERRSQRSLEARTLYDEGFAAFTSGDLVTARRAFAMVADLTPDDIDARAMLRRTDQAIVQQIGTLMNEGRGLARAGLFDEARGARSTAANLGAAGDSLKVLDGFIAEAVRRQDYEQERRRTERAREAALANLNGNAQELSVTAENKEQKASINPSRRRELEALAERPLGLQQQGQTDEAVRIWELVWDESPDVADVRSRLVEEYLQQGMGHFAAGRLEDAVGSWEQALRVDPEDRRTRSYLDRARQQLNRIKRLRDDTGR